MPFSEFEIAKHSMQLDAFIEKISPPKYMRNELDYGYLFDNQSIIVFEKRPLYNDPSKTIESHLAKATFVKASKAWKIYWMRANDKWEVYDPTPQVKQLSEFCDVVAVDEMCCFFG